MSHLHGYAPSIIIIALVLRQKAECGYEIYEKNEQVCICNTCLDSALKYGNMCFDSKYVLWQ